MRILSDLQRRLLTVAASIPLAVTTVLLTGMPVASHGNSCTVGNSNYVVIVFVDGGQAGTSDDICWLGTHSFDDAFSVADTGIDDIGENGSFHDSVSSFAIKNFGPTGLCARFYRNESLSTVRETQWVGDGEGDIHFSVAVNDDYDSLDLLLVSQATCFN